MLNTGKLGQLCTDGSINKKLEGTVIDGDVIHQPIFRKKIVQT